MRNHTMIVLGMYDHAIFLLKSDYGWIIFLFLSEVMSYGYQFSLC